MRTLLISLLVPLSCTIAAAQTMPSPQTARQALIEMFFGTAPDHAEKHLPEITRTTLKKLGAAPGMSVIDDFNGIAQQAKMIGKLETFDTGPILLSGEGVEGNKLELRVERNDLMGDKDEIELSLHSTKENKEQSLPFVPRFVFVMKSEADVWRLNEVTASIKAPLADPAFLKSLEDRQRTLNEQMAIRSMRDLLLLENIYSRTYGSFACSLAVLGGENAKRYDWQLLEGKKGSYVYAISACDALHFKVTAGPVMPNLGERAFCTDESGTIRASADGKVTTCLDSGNVVEQIPLYGHAGEHVGSPTQAQRVRVSAGVMQGLSISKVPPEYPAEVRAAGVQGRVVMAAVIGKDGSVQNLRVIGSASPLLNQAAIEATKQWKYRPYLLNGEPVEVNTTITIDFALGQTSADMVVH